MKPAAEDGKIIVSQNSLIISCKNKVLNTALKELFKLVPKNTKIKDVKKL